MFYTAQQGFSPIVSPSIISGIKQDELVIPAASASASHPFGGLNQSTSLLMYRGLRSEDTGFAAQQNLPMININYGGHATVAAQTYAANSSDSRIVGYTVAEFAPWAVKSIQTGVIAIPDLSQAGSATIASIDTENAFVVWNGANYSHLSPTATFNDTAADLELLNATTVTATRQGKNNQLYVGYSVIEFYPGIIKAIQKVTVSITGFSTIGNATIGAVDDNATLTVWNGWRATSLTGATYIPWAMLYARRTSATSVSALRGVASFATARARVSVVEFFPEWVRSRGSHTINVGGGSIGTNISDVTEGKTLISWLGHTIDSNVTNAAEPYATTKLNSYEQILTQREATGHPTSTLTASFEFMEFI